MEWRRCGTFGKGARRRRIEEDWLRRERLDNGGRRMVRLVHHADMVTSPSLFRPLGRRAVLVHVLEAGYEGLKFRPLRRRSLCLNLCVFF